MPKQNRKPGIHLHKTEILKPAKKGKPKSETYYKSEFYWILIAKNGKTIARSSEMYKTKRAAVKSIGIAADITTGIKPREYYDHTGKNGVELVEF